IAGPIQYFGCHGQFSLLTPVIGWLHRMCQHSYQLGHSAAQAHAVRNCVNSSQQFVPGLNSRTRNACSRVPGNIMSYDISALTFSTCPRRGTRLAQLMGITGTGSLGKGDMDSDFVFQVSPGAAEVPLSVLKIRDEAALEALDQLAVEEPLEIRLG